MKQCRERKPANKNAFIRKKTIDISEKILFIFRNTSGGKPVARRPIIQQRHKPFDLRSQFMIGQEGRYGAL